MPRKKSPKVIERKLGKHKAVGLAWQEDGIIEIDPRQKPKEYLSTLIHEAAHIIYPDWDEKDVRLYRDWETDRKSTRLNSSHRSLSRMPSSA